MSQNLNQFGLGVIKGQLDMSGVKNSISCVVDSTEATALTPGQFVKIVDSAGGVPKVIKCAADSDEAFGVIVYNVKDQSFSAGDAVEVAVPGACVYLEASAAIARGAKLMPVISGSKVATATAGKSVIGWALDKAAADGDLIRVVMMQSDKQYIQAATVAAVATADGSDAATTQALANALKVSVNAILASLKAANKMA